MFKTDNIQSSKMEEEKVCCCAQSSTYTERPNPPLIEEETLFLKYVNVYGRTNILRMLLLVFLSWSDPMCYVDVQHRQYSVSI
jgi:hypothetical protein